MDPFEYFIGLYTIIVGLGITLLVRSVGQMIEGADRLRRYWVHTGWLGLIFVAHVSSWFFLWKYHGITQWRVAEALLMLVVPVLLYLASHLAVPEIEESGEGRYDLRAYYYSRGRFRWIQGLLGASILATLLIDGLLLEIRMADPSQANRILALAVILPGLLSRRPWIHAAQMIALLALVLAGTLLEVGEGIGS